MIISFDLSTLNSPKQAFAKSMLMNKEMIAINQVRTIVRTSRYACDGHALTVEYDAL